MSFYSKLAGVADKVLRKYGKLITINRRSGVAYTPGGGVTQTEAVVTAYGQIFDYTQREINGTTVLAGDRRVILAEKDLTFIPDPTTDFIVIDSVDHNIITVKRPVHEQVILDLQVRRA